MLGNFVYCNPGKLYFGDEAQKHLVDAVRPFGKKVVLAYGGGSIKKNGIYDDAVSALNKAGKDIIELSGIMPNPTVEKMNEGAKLVRESNADLILAVGGGSAIDYAKAVSVAAWCDGDAWERFWVKQEEPGPNERIVPVGSVLTMVGTGSEMNGGSVITNHASKMKIGKVFGERVMPKFAILNPRYTFTVPHYQMVAGIYDMFCHVMEQYFSGDDDSTSDYLSEGLMRSIIHSGRVAVKNPQDYEARSNLMWSSTWALNTLIGEGKKQDWMVHMIGHAIGSWTDATHGMTLSGISLPYYTHIMKKGVKRFDRFAKVVWGISPEGKTDEELALAGIEALGNWIKEIGAVSKIGELGVKADMLDGIADATIILDSGYVKLTRPEIIEILRASL